MSECIELFYYKGLPTDIIYDGNHTQFTREYLTKTKKNKFMYRAEIDNITFIHDASHILAVFQKNSTKPIIYHCSERKDNNKLHGQGKAFKLTTN